MTISFQATDETVSRGRNTKPIPADVLAAVDQALKTKQNVTAVVSEAEGNELRSGFNRLRKNDPSIHFTLSIRPGKAKGTVQVLLVDVKKDK
jgi:hypothetical protein